MSRKTMWYFVIAVVLLVLWYAIFIAGWIKNPFAKAPAPAPPATGGSGTQIKKITVIND